MELSMYQSYTQFKNELDNEIKREAEGFVKIGYLLRVAQDTDILSQSEYANVNEFAKAEYGLDKSQVSRFIAINERFSQNGYAPELDLRYQGFGVAKLGIMLKLPDAVNEQLSPEFSKAEINEIKEEYKEEQKISDIEVLLEGKSADPLLEQIIDKILHDHPEIYEEIWLENKKAVDMGLRCSSKDYADDVMAAAGEALYTVRVEGYGKVMLTIRGGREKLVITNMRTGEIQEPEWDDLGRLLWFQPTWRNAELEWVDRYQEEWPIKTQTVEKKEEKKPQKVVTTPKETPKKAEKPINTHTEKAWGVGMSQQQAEEPKVEEKPMNTQSEEFMNKPVTETEIEPVEEDIEEIVEEIEEVAPVQQSEKPMITHAEPVLVETKTLIQLKDEIVKKLGEVIGFVYESKWADVQGTLDDIDFMVKGCISEELKMQQAEDEEDE